jgi:hypothetical protein
MRLETYFVKMEKKRMKKRVATTRMKKRVVRTGIKSRVVWGT